MNFYLILPNIRSCHNVGAMFRTADAFAVTKMFLAGYTAEPPKPQIDKVSLGAETWVPWERCDDVPGLIARLQAEGVLVVALEKTGTSVTFDQLPIAGSVALIVGNEVDGVSDDILALCDGVVHIDMYGKKTSLNVSIAAGIALFEIRNRLQQLIA